MKMDKTGRASSPVLNSVSEYTEKKMDIPTPLMPVYISTVPSLMTQPYPQLSAAYQEPTVCHLAPSLLYSKEVFPFLTFKFADRQQSLVKFRSLAASSPTARPKSTGKHVCHHCGRDCMKPSVLEKHLRCHTGERPYPCTTCGISFKTQSNLYKHKRTQAHARLLSESDQSWSGSLESMSSSRGTCTSSMSSMDEQHEGQITVDEDLGSRENNPDKITYPGSKHSSVMEQNKQMPSDHKTKEADKIKKVTIEVEKPLLVSSRHLALHRQEATLFSKQWECSVSREKSQNHESTDSGFSENGDHYSTADNILLHTDHSIDPPTESSNEHLKETSNTERLPEASESGQESKGTNSKQEQKTLEEHISKLISENAAAVEDKQLENVRPRKTFISKKGSINLPMPYTYKDSFQFDMRINKNSRPHLYRSVPTQPSTTIEHSPLTHCKSLPVSVTLLQSERSSPTSLSQSVCKTPVQSSSSGKINPTDFKMTSVNQQYSTHRPLVRQTAIDCNQTTDILYMNSSVEEPSTTSCDRDGTGIYGEPNNRKFQRKKAQKFAYNKWYMYRGGTFKKLYNKEKGVCDSTIKGSKLCMNPKPEIVPHSQNKLSEVHKKGVAIRGTPLNFINNNVKVCHPDCVSTNQSSVSTVDFNVKSCQFHTSCSSFKSPIQGNLFLSKLPSLVSYKTENVRMTEGYVLSNNEKRADSISQLCSFQIPSNRTQKSDEKRICPQEIEACPNTPTHLSLQVTGDIPHLTTNMNSINFQNFLKHNILFESIKINTKPSPHSMSPTGPPPVTKTSFLPKYQLLLPNTAEPNFRPTSGQVVNKPTATGDHNFISALSPSYTEQTLITSFTESCDILNTHSSTLIQDCLPTTKTIHQDETSIVNTNAISSVHAVHKKFSTTTTNTTCRDDYQAGLGSSSVQPSKYVECAAPMHLPSPTATMVANFPATPVTTTADNQADLSQPNHNHPLSKTPLLTSSEQLSLSKRANTNSDTPIVPRHIVLFDQIQSVAQNVFHVHTADLQICLQLISDEQLALIEPHIERQAQISDGSSSTRADPEKS